MRTSRLSLCTVSFQACQFCIIFTFPTTRINSTIWLFLSRNLYGFRSCWLTRWKRTVNYLLFQDLFSTNTADVLKIPFNNSNNSNITAQTILSILSLEQFKRSRKSNLNYNLPQYRSSFITIFVSIFPTTTSTVKSQPKTDRNLSILNSNYPTARFPFLVTRTKRNYNFSLTVKLPTDFVYNIVKSVPLSDAITYNLVT